MNTDTQQQTTRRDAAKFSRREVLGIGGALLLGGTSALGLRQWTRHERGFRNDVFIGRADGYDAPLAQLITEGLVKQVLLAHDIYAKHRLANYGGHGYDHLLTNIVPRMKVREIKEEDIQTMLVENPRCVLAFA